MVDLMAVEPGDCVVQSALGLNLVDGREWIINSVPPILFLKCRQDEVLIQGMGSELLHQQVAET